MLRPGYRWTSNPRGLYVTPVLQEDGRPERPKKEKSKPLLFAGGELKASGGSNRDAKDALSKLLQMGTVAEYDSEAFSLARAMEARFAKEALSKLLQMGTRTITTIVNPNDLNIEIPDQVLEESILHTSDKGEITSDNDARDQASEVEMKVLVDGKQDDTKVVGVAVEQKNDKPNVLEGNGVIGVGVNEINKWVDKEVQYSVSILHVLIPIIEVVRITTDHLYGLDFMEQIIMMRENDKPDSFSDADFNYLNKNDIEDLYYLCQNKKVSRYKDTTLTKFDEDMTKNGPAAKVLWYLPIIPRLKQLYLNPKNAKLLRWHAKDQKIDEKMRHVADSSQWKNIDNHYTNFRAEIRNIRFGLNSDGINPFGNMSSRHSTWPVLLCIYNLPPWLCMKRKYIMMSLLIQGPKQAGNDIDVYLAPLIDDMIDLWDKGVKVYDAESLTGLLLNIKGKTKDRINVWKDIVEIGIRDELTPQEIGNKRTYFLATCYTLSKAEKIKLFQCLRDIKVPLGYSANIKKLVLMKGLKLIGEIKACELVFLHYMYPFERYMGFLKGYVRNQSWPKGSIVKGYVSEELVSFCTSYIDGILDICVPESRQEGDQEKKKDSKAPIQQSKVKKEKADIRKRLHLLKEDIDQRSEAVKKDIIGGWPIRIAPCREKLGTNILTLSQ
ncbi:hypothetical protein Tco_0162805, partial [Tanacetum coccineum]